jgi:hypothetical protein
MPHMDTGEAERLRSDGIVGQTFVVAVEQLPCFDSLNWSYCRLTGLSVRKKKRANVCISWNLKPSPLDQVNSFFYTMKNRLSVRSTRVLSERVISSPRKRKPMWKMPDFFSTSHGIL